MRHKSTKEKQMRITQVNIKNYKCLRTVTISPDGKNMILIAGMNEQGKTSLIGAFSACLGGKGETPERPIRDGEESAEIGIELKDDAGKLGYKVTRKFLKNGKSILKVTGRDGRVSSPQKLMDKIIGKRFLNPIEFLRQSPKAQRESLLEFIDIGIDLDQWAKMRQETFDTRTDVNRHIKRCKVQVEDNPHPGAIPEALDANIAERVSDLNEAKNNRRKAEDLIANLKKEYKDRSDSIAKIESDLAIEKKMLLDVASAGKAAKVTLESFPDVTDELDKAMDELRASSEINNERHVKIAQADKYQIAKKELYASEVESEELTLSLCAMDKDKEDRLAAAKMPIDGLEINDDTILYNGIPLSQASGAQKLSVSLAISTAMSPGLNDIWIEDGALLDENSLKRMEAFAQENNLCIWIERVGESDDGAIIIRDGEIVE